MNAQIAQHLNVAESAILEVQEWARVLWVRVRGIGARFVSKKVAKVEQVKSIEDRLVEAGGNRWQKAGKDRIYFSNADIRRHYGLETTHYNTGNISTATFCDRPISNSEAKRIWGRCDGKLWWDVPAQKWQSQNIDSEVFDRVVLAIEVECGM